MTYNNCRQCLTEKRVLEIDDIIQENPPPRKANCKHTGCQFITRDIQSIREPVIAPDKSSPSPLGLFVSKKVR